MSVLYRSLWLKRLAVVLVTVLSIGALTVASTPANARVFIGFGIGAPVGWGYYAPPPYYGYYGYPYPYYRAYGYPDFFVGGTFGPHRYWHHHYWR